MPLTATERQRRSRAHRSGNHSLCDPLRCREAADVARAALFAEVIPVVTEVTGGLARIVKVGDRKQALQAIRDRMAEMLEGEEDPRDAAALSRELRALMAELASLDVAPQEPRSGLDELERRRRERPRAEVG